MKRPRTYIALIVSVLFAHILLAWPSASGQRVLLPDRASARRTTSWQQEATQEPRAYFPIVFRGTGRNLLLNPDFEAEFHQYLYYASAIVAEEWNPWWVEQGEDDPAWKNRMPEYKPAAPYEDRIWTGSNAQQYFTYYATHVGGIYQRVDGIVPDTRLCFSIWGHAWAGDGSDPGHSEGGGPMHMRVGIDAEGGVEPFSPTVIWSEEQDPLDVWSLFTVEAQANADQVTVYTWSAPENPTQHNDVFWDHASLVTVEPVSP
jgi:hypothetical protein